MTTAKKITELSAHTNATGDNLLVVVANVSSTATTKKISLTNFFANVQSNVVFKNTVSVGANLSLNTAAVFIGNGSVNTVLNASGLTTGVLNTKEVYESVQTIANANGVISHNCSNGHIFVHNTPANNFTANLVSMTLANNNATTVVLVINQGATPYIANAVHISGSSQTISWQGGTEPAGSANKKDIVSFSILNLSGSYTVLGQLTSFG